MTSHSNGQAAIVRTERGLTISGTRITLYDVMDYLSAQYPIPFIRDLFDLSEKQISTALAYIEANRTEVEAEYQKVLQDTEELRLYYEEQNRERVSRIATLPPPPGLEAAWEKLQASKARHQLQAQMILLTANRSMKDEDSLEQVMREENTQDSLPVVTIGNADRVLNDSTYREQCVDRIVEIAIYTANYMGARRVFIP